jgi:hypothetical protein
MRNRNFTAPAIWLGCTGAPHIPAQRDPGFARFALDGSGQVVFRFTPEHPVTAHSISVYEHYVASPAALGAATSPVAMSSLLVVALEP